MAEPARKLPEQDPRDYSWQPRVIAGGGEGGGQRGNLRSVPTEHNIETPAEEAAHNGRHLSLVPSLNEAEGEAAAGANRPQSGSLATREQAPNYYYKPSVGKAKRQAREAIAGAKQRSADYRAKGGRRRGILIGLGAGGGILSVVAGFSALLPFKLPGIMDTLIGDAGKRIEKVVERRAERVFIQYILKGSSAAVKNGSVIATGNPIGDLFANIRTSKFEKKLLDSKGLSIEASPDGKGVRLKYKGDYLRDPLSPDTDFSNGTLKNSNDIFKLLDSGKSLTRADLRAIVRTNIPAWKFWQRAKFVNWLALKYNISRFGTREQEQGEKDEDYEKAVKKEHIQQVEKGNLLNMNDFVDCAADSGDCIDRADQGEKMSEQAAKAIEEAAEDLSKEGARKATSTVTKLVTGKLLTIGGVSAVPVFGWVDTGARLMHGMREIVNGGLLQKKHAEYIKRSTAILGTAYAGYADQTKAGDNKAEIVGMFSDNFDGWEGSVSYGIIQSQSTRGPIVGQNLEPMERAQETVPTNTFIDSAKTAFNVGTWAGGPLLEAWYLTVSKAVDFVGDFAGDIVTWIMDRTPTAKILLAQIAPLMSEVFTGVMKFVGMNVDPLEVGPRLALFVHQGFLGAFNDKGKEDGMRELSEAQGLAMDQQIRQDHIADLQNQSLYDRIFNLDSEDSLATHLVTTMPSSTAKDPIGSLSAASARLVASVPNNVSRITSGSATAATAQTATSESLFGLNIYAGNEDDLSAELSPAVAEKNPECPENKDNAFNHCKVDRGVVESMNCVFVKCADMYGQDAYVQGSPLFAYGAEGPLYGPDAVEPQPKFGAVAIDWTKTTGLLAALIPIGALEISRRKTA